MPANNITMFPVPVIHAQALAAHLEYLLIGGHAVNAYCAPRSTLDVDLLVRRRDTEAWRQLVIGEGFRLSHEAESFVQFTPPYGTAWRLDLMRVNDSTFDTLWAAAKEISCLGVSMRVVSATHLIALKLHAVRYGPPERGGRDLSDVINLMRVTGYALDSPELQRMVQRYGSPEIQERLRQLLGG